MHSPLPPFDPLEAYPRSTAELLSDLKPLHMEPVDIYSKDHYGHEVHTTQDMFVPTSALSRSSSYPDPTSAFMSPISGGSPYDYTVPAFSEFTTRESRRGLLDHFCNVLSHLIVFKEDSGNPFRQLVLPLAQKSPPLLNAIYAISSAHLEHRGLRVEERALDLHSQALQGLANLIAHKDEGNRDEVLAVIILLLYYEASPSLTGSGAMWRFSNSRVACAEWVVYGAEQSLERCFVYNAAAEGSAGPDEHFLGASMQFGLVAVVQD